MKTLNIITLALLIIGGINWGLVGVAQFDLDAARTSRADGTERHRWRSRLIVERCA